MVFGHTAGPPVPPVHARATLSNRERNGWAYIRWQFLCNGATQLIDDAVILESVDKTFRSRPGWWKWIGRESASPTVALRHVSLKGGAGRIVVVLGPNGSGKTTLLKIISTMLLPDRGRVVVAGADAATDAGQVRKSVGFAVANERSFFARLTGRENLEFFAALEDVPRDERQARVEQVLQVTGLDDAADRLAMKYSSGMFQRLGIARALLKRPSVLLLDEPSRSLDPGATEHLWDTVRQSADAGAAVVLTTHHFEEAAAVADDIVLLQHGTIVARRQAGLRMSAADVRSFYFDHVREAQTALATCTGATR